jgi:hypothetical protein
MASILIRSKTLPGVGLNLVSSVLPLIYRTSFVTLCLLWCGALIVFFLVHLPGHRNWETGQWYGPLVFSMVLSIMAFAIVIYQASRFALKHLYRYKMFY